MLFFRSELPFHGLSRKLELLVRGRLWLQSIIGLTLGVTVGILLGPVVGWMRPESAAIITEWLALPGQIFLRLMRMVLIPLTMLSIIRGFGGRTDTGLLRKVGMRFILYVIVTTIIASAIGTFLALVIRPGTYVHLPRIAGTPIVPSAPGHMNVLVDIPRIIADLIPSNPLAAALELELLGIVVFSVLIGIALAKQPNHKIEPLLTILDTILDITMTIVKWAMLLTPWVVFGLTAQMVSQVGVQTLIGVGIYVCTVLLGLGILLLLYYVLVTVLTGRNPLRFAWEIAGVQLLAFSTSSSAAVMPSSIRLAEESLHVDASVSHVVVPLGATVNMAGTALYLSTAILFLAQVGGMELTMPTIFLVVTTLIASAIGAPGTPGISLAVLATVAAKYGIPAEGLLILMGVDRILDMCRTTLNVTGDLTACVILDPGSRKGGSWWQRWLHIARH